MIHSELYMFDSITSDTIVLYNKLLVDFYSLLYPSHGGIMFLNCSLLVLFQEPHIQPTLSFKVNVESFNKTLPMKEKL